MERFKPVRSAEYTIRFRISSSRSRMENSAKRPSNGPVARDAFDREFENGTSVIGYLQDPSSARTRVTWNSGN